MKRQHFKADSITVADLTKEGNVIQFGQPPLRIDLLTSIDGVAFDACYANRKVVTFDGLPMNFIGYHDLITNKKATGRHRDLDGCRESGTAVKAVSFRDMRTHCFGPVQLVRLKGTRYLDIRRQLRKVQLIVLRETLIHGGF